MGRHLRVQLRCWSNSGDARCVRDFVFVRFYVLMLGYLLTLRFELPKLLTLVVSFSLWQPTPLSPTSASPPSSWHLLHPPAPPHSYPAGVPTLQKQTFTGRYLPYKIWGRKYYISYVGQVWHLRARLGICRDRRDRQSCKIFVSCVNFFRKQRSFLLILQVYTHLNVNFLHNC